MPGRRVIAGDALRRGRRRRALAYVQPMKVNARRFLSFAGLSMLTSIASCELAIPPFELSGPAACTLDVDPAPDRAACAFGMGADPHNTLACPASGPDIPVQHIIVMHRR